MTDTGVCASVTGIQGAEFQDIRQNVKCVGGKKAELLLSVPWALHLFTVFAFLKRHKESHPVVSVLRGSIS